jgi:hypothetical protein
MKVYVFLGWLKNDGLRPDVHTYASLLLIFARFEIVYT